MDAYGEIKIIHIFIDCLTFFFGRDDLLRQNQIRATSIEARLARAG